MNIILRSLFVLVFTTSIYAGHHEGGNHMHGNTAEWEINAYTSAAPAFIGKHATVIGASGKVLREGTNGWRCEPFMPMPKDGFKHPHETAAACSDKNAVAWANAYKSNNKPELEGDGWIWMIHGDLGVDNFKPYTDGQKDAGHKHFIESGAHMMLMPKDPSSLDGQTTDYTTGAPYVMFKGTPYVHLMIPLEGYYDYQPESAPK
ncbi:hypothetical protein OA526_00710 [Gammaproteobacteria bacterium]|nr:hypothetical protein [Gammaproteobacteria bacterium]|tara:strand:+ start:2654 stop:3265 length:612 start_codon:yes stop_codon:yes gene_type:complete